MPKSLEAGLPQFRLTDGYQIVFEARDSTGTAVAGVNVSNTILFADVDGNIAITTVGDTAQVVLLPIGGGAVTGAVAGVTGGVAA